MTEQAGQTGQTGQTGRVGPVGLVGSTAGFDLYGELPAGTTVLEASAGTGKTWTIAALAVRYVAEGHVELSELMLATFGRAATQELRERVRERFVSTARGLGDPDCTDELVRHLSAAGAGEVVARRRRLVRALSGFDAATIVTTHGFCVQVLDSLGMSGEHEPGVRFVESVDDLLAQVVDDLYLRKFAVHGAEPVIDRKQALEAAQAAVGDPEARIEPAAADPASAPGLRVGVARAARKELERRKRAAGIRDFDDMLALLRDVLADPLGGPAACDRLRSRYRVVLVDEFQDTDPVQWQILRLAFHGHTTLVLVGDPKQAIYAFRGAEVRSYLEAARTADRHAALDTNWRSDLRLVRALDHLYGGAALGHADILVKPVEASHRDPRLLHAPPVRLRVLGRTGLGPLWNGLPKVGQIRARVARDVAADIVALLAGPARLRSDGPEPGPERRAEPGDIAVLVRKKAQGEAVQAELDQRGVPSVLVGSSSVFATPSARDWLWLLQALEQPHRARAVRLAALTPLLGWTAEGLDAAPEQVLDEIGGLIRECAHLVEEAGVAAAFEHLSARTGLERRILSTASGERQLTDLRHLAQTLNRAAAQESLGVRALVSWLAERVDQPEGSTLEDRSRRLESDAAAVTIVTVHGSKGLEFPVVYVPYAWDGARNPEPPTLLLHDPDGKRVLDVGGKAGPGWAARKRDAEAEGDGEELRLLYVALTRAMCQVVLWWAPSSGTAVSPLHRLLLGRAKGDPEPAPRPALAEDGPALVRLAQWARPAAISVEAVGSVALTRWEGVEGASPPIGVARFGRVLDGAWRRTSYSGLTAAVHDAGPPGPGGSEPETPGTSDEPDGAMPPAGVDLRGGPPSSMNGLPAGAAFGTLVHEVLEVLDTSAPDLPAELLACCAATLGRRLSSIDPVVLADALLPVLHTPLGFGTLAGIAPRDRLAELDFEMPLCGGDTPTATSARLRDIAALLRAHLPPDDPLASYAHQLEAMDDVAPLRGYLAGSIDAVLRLHPPGAPGGPGAPGPVPTYVVVDYKTNLLGRGDVTALHYNREAMAAEMLRWHYPLQALLYSVALHRYLRWRQPGYAPAVHLGGAAYLFLRGMVGPTTPPGCGVFAWKPPPALVVAVSDLLAGAP